MASITNRENLPDMLFRRYRAIPKAITALQLSEPEDILSSYAEKETFHGEPGDWKIIHGTASNGSLDIAICNRDIFRKIFEHVEGDKYRKKSSFVIEAAQLQEPLDIMTLEGPAHAEAGDWLLLGIEGEPYFNSDAYFKSSYVLTDE